MSTRKINMAFLRLSDDIEYITGAERVIWEMVKSLETMPFNPIPVFIVNTDNKPKQPFLFKKFGIDAHCVQGNKPFDLKQFRFLMTLLKKQKIRILHSNDFKSDSLALLLKCFLPSLKIVSTNHGYIRTSLKKKINYRLNQFVLHFFDKNIIVSKAMMNFVPSAVRKKTIVIYNSINPDYWIRKVSRQEKNMTGRIAVIGFAGRISKEKGWKEFVLVAENVLKLFPTTSFTVAGDGPDFNEMVKQTETLAIRSNFTFLGAVDDIKSFYQSIDLLLAPSWTEGLPMVQLEANAMNVPVVATDVGGVKELITDGYNGLLAPPFDIEKISNQVIKLMKQPDLTVKMRQNGRQRVLEHFSIEATRDQLSNLYSLLLK